MRIDFFFSAAKTTKKKNIGKKVKLSLFQYELVTGTGEVRNVCISFISKFFQ